MNIDQQRLEKPLHTERKKQFCGKMAGTVVEKGSIIEPLDDEWKEMLDVGEGIWDNDVDRP